MNIEHYGELVGDAPKHKSGDIVTGKLGAKFIIIQPRYIRNTKEIVVRWFFDLINLDAYTVYDGTCSFLGTYYAKDDNGHPIEDLYEIELEQ